MNRANGEPSGLEAPNRPHVPGRKAWATVLLSGLASGKLALALILLLIAFSLAGAILPQEGQVTPAEVSQWQDRHPVVTGICEPIGLFNAFHCWPFLATIVLLAVNTLTCTVSRLYRQGGLREFTGPVAIERTGFVLVHLSLIVLFAGGFWSAAASMDAKVVLTEGQEFTDKHDQYLQLQEGPLRRDRHTGLVFRLDDVDVRYARQQHKVAVTSTLGILEDDKRVAAGAVEVNKPFEYERLSFTQDETGYSPRLVIRDAMRGRQIIDSFVALRTLKTETGREYRDFLPLPFLKQRVVVTLFPNFINDNGQVRKTGDAPENPLLLLEAEDKSGRVAESHQLQLGEGATVGQYRFTFADLRQWASFRVGHDPGYPLVCAALWLGLAALVLRYLPDLRHWLREPVPKTASPSGLPPLQRPLPVDAEDVTLYTPACR